jgi:hypothetical protein
MSRLRCITLFLVLIFSLVPLGMTHAIDQITLYVPAFQGPGALGRNVTTILNLQVWQTFRHTPRPSNPEKLDFGIGLVIWDTRPLNESSHRDAEERAMALEMSAQMTMWGKVYPTEMAPWQNAIFPYLSTMIFASVNSSAGRWSTKVIQSVSIPLGTATKWRHSIEP